MKLTAAAREWGGRLLNEARVMIRDKTLDRALDRLRKPERQVGADLHMRHRFGPQLLYRAGRRSHRRRDDAEVLEDQRITARPSANWKLGDWRN